MMREFHGALLKLAAKAVGLTVLKKLKSSTVGWYVHHGHKSSVIFDYKIIASKHINITLAFLNDGVEIERLDKASGWKLDLNPEFDSSSEYRVKPPSPQTKD